jgi:hypothetical protein
MVTSDGGFCRFVRPIQAIRATIRRSMPDQSGPALPIVCRSNIGSCGLSCGYAAWWYSLITPASTGSSPDGPQVGKVGRVPGRRRSKARRSLAPRLVRPGSVVVGQVFAEYQFQMAFAEDRDPVQEFAAEGVDDAFADGVRPRRLRQGGDDPHPFGLEHFIERGGEERIAIMNQEP